MIRKMAAINMYIRGLNPQNIEQGDALKMFNPVVDGNSKSVVIANPPFGAERDQPAYPNIWEEHSKETETTILFVKLMFELLQKGGRCAVVVSEGLLTWDQNSAKALRKLLLEDAKLRAVISLPQGVFVSMVEIAIEKGGTHILMPVSARKQLNDLPDDLATKINVYYYSDARDALIKALVE